MSRSGGDEFVILLPDTRIAAACIVSVDIRIKLNDLSIEGVYPSTPILAVADTVGNDYLDAVINEIDDLMYLAKSECYNCVRYRLKSADNQVFW